MRAEYGARLAPHEEKFQLAERLHQQSADRAEQAMDTLAQTGQYNMNQYVGSEHPAQYECACSDRSAQCEHVGSKRLARYEYAGEQYEYAGSDRSAQYGSAGEQYEYVGSEHPK